MAGLISVGRSALICRGILAPAIGCVNKQSPGAEIRSQTDVLRTLRAKMEEYIASGAQVGWLIDPSTRRVFTFRPDRPMETLLNPSAIAGDPVLSGFVLEVGGIWEVTF
jgi:Uma2 family endonuclease